MNVYLKFLRLFLVLMVGVFFLVGCNTDKPRKNNNTTNSPSHNEASNSSNSSSNEENNNNQNIEASSQNEENDDSVVSSNREKTEYYEMYAERKLVIDIDIPFEISNYITATYPKNGNMNYDINKQQIYYKPNFGFIGKDTFSLTFSKNGTTSVDNKKIKIKYIIDIQKAPLEGNRDFVISKFCTDNNLYIDVDFVDNDLNIIKKLYDDKFASSSNNYFPTYSRIQVDYFGEKDEFSVRHHKAFKENLDKIFLITCNYPNGYKRLMLPIASNEWYADTPHRFSNRHFDRNNLYFYISHLSELYIQIYLKEYQKTLDYDNSIKKASQFMERVFPNTHYKEEFARKYNTLPNDPINNQYGQLYMRFEEDNKESIDILYNLSNEVTNGNVFTLVKKIATNYESFYLSNNHICLDKTICATFFPEYVSSVTNNPSFKNGFDGWIKDEEIYNIAVGGINYLPEENEVSIELRANIPSDTNEPISSIDLYQTKVLNDDTIDDYFLYFDLANALGAADGGASFLMCTSSSGFTGTYALFRDKNNKQIGLLAWTDHCNKFDYKFSYFLNARNAIDSTDRFYNTRLRNVVRRVNPAEKRFEFTVSIGELTKKYMPIVYKEKDKIYSIEYGIFTTEHRNSSNGCYFCNAKIIAHEINLLKIKK